uniref:Purple acid phosphatase n=1 Tax=Strongyloides stercoralis TaxID=6248 RepID=A0A0K0EBS5_STRER
MIFIITIQLNIFFLLNLIINGLEESLEHEQVHLSLGKDPRTMVVSWLNMEEKGIPFSYKVMYYYKVGDGKRWSKTFYFKTFPKTSRFKLKFCTFGDSDTGKMFTINELKKSVKRGECQMIIHLGDIAYQLQRDNGFTGDDFMRKIEPIAAYVPYMVIVGNHEFDCHGFTHYNYRFAMPYDKNNADDVDHFYSFNIGLVNFIGLSSEIYGFYKLYGINPIKKQTKWFDKTLKSIEKYKKIRPWTITFFHRPIYCWHRFIPDECNEYESSTLRVGHKKIPGLERYLHKYNVDVVLNAHEHGYQRNYPIFNRTVYKYKNNIYHNSPATTYILSGAGGCNRCTPAIFNNSGSLPFAAKRTISVGYTQINVINKTHMKINQIDTENKAIVDSFWIVKDLGFKMSRSKKSRRVKGKYAPYNGDQIYQYLEPSRLIKKCIQLYNISMYNEK